MAKPYHRFTTSDDNIIIEEIQSFPENLQACFKEAAGKIGVSKQSVQDRYYKILRRRNTCFTTISKEHGIINTKNFHLKSINTPKEEKQVYIDTPNKFWNKVVKTFKKYIPFIN